MDVLAVLERLVVLLLAEPLAELDEAARLVGEDLRRVAQDMMLGEIRLVARDRRPRLDRRGQARRVLHDGHPRGTKGRQGDAEGRSDVVVDERDPEVLRRHDDEPVRVRRRLPDERDVDRVQVAWVRAGDVRHDETDVRDGPGHRTDGDQRLPGLGRWLAGHRAERRLEPDDAAERGRDPDGPAAVAAHRDGADARRDRRAGAARRPTRRPGEVPRIARPAVDGRFGDARVAELGHRGLGEDHGPGLFQALQDHGRLVRHEAAHREGPVSTLDAGQPLRVLGADRKTGQRSARTPPKASVRRVGRMQGSLVEIDREGVHGLTDGLGA